MERLLAVILAALIGAILGLVWAVHVMQGAISRDCERMGITRIGEKVYSCRPAEKL